MVTFAVRRSLNVSEWAPIQERMGALQIALGGNVGVMMFSVDTGSVSSQDIYIGLPSANQISSFPGFEIISQDTLPDCLRTLIVNETGFKEAFPDIARKRRIKER